MNRVALTLALLGAPGLVVLGLVQSSRLVPALLPPLLAALGGLTAIAGAATSRPRVQGAGTILAILGASLTGVGHEIVWLGLGVASATLLIASLNLHLVLPEEGAGFMLAVTAVVSAVLVAVLGLLAARVAGWIGGGGVDATGGVTAWLVLLVAVTWALARWAREAQPR